MFRRAALPTFVAPARSHALQDTGAVQRLRVVARRSSADQDRAPAGEGKGNGWPIWAIGVEGGLAFGLIISAVVYFGLVSTPKDLPEIKDLGYKSFKDAEKVVEDRERSLNPLEKLKDLFFEARLLNLDAVLKEEEREKAAGVEVLEEGKSLRQFEKELLSRPGFDPTGFSVKEVQQLAKVRK